jgi:hypothetical protein
MIVVTSNWALGDGTLVPASAAWHGPLTTAIHRAVLRAGVRGDGGYRPVERLDLVLAGDTFDWLLSAEWQAAVKPWHATAAAREAATRVARRSIRAARRVLGPVIHWARHGLSVPAAVRGRPGRMPLSIPVRVTLLAGDRDAAIGHHVGRRDARQPVTTGSRWDDGRVSIRHGHELDPACRTADERPAPRDRQPTLAESVAVDLVGRFAAALRPQEPAGKRLVSSLAAVGPTGIPAVIAAAIDAAAGSPTGGAPSLATAWRRSVDAWWHDARRTVPACEVEFDAVDALAGWFAAGREAADRVPAGLDRLRPRQPRAAPGLVLGHLPAAEAATTACLGPVPGDTRAAVPRLIACLETDGWPRWQSVLPAEDRAAVVAIREPERAAADGGRIVDAA